MALVKISGIATSATSFDAGDLVEQETAAGASKKMTREVMLKPRGALVKKTTSLTGHNLTTGYIPILFDAEEYDTDSCHDNSTNTDRLVTSSWSTWARVGGQVALANVSANVGLEWLIQKNAGTNFYGAPYHIGSGVPTNPSMAVWSPWIAIVGGTDYFKLMVKVSTDTSVDFVDPFTWFAIELQ